MKSRLFRAFPGQKFPCWAAIALLALGKVCAQSQPSDDFANKSIEELMNIDVTSVSRKDQKLSKIPAAVYVITQEAIKRSGATIIPDLLRMAPGVQVAQVEANRWAISVRGFNGIYSNKLLVLVDGRTVYTPSFSGVYWDQLLEIPLDTIDRIEIVRGPGGAVWGANAVNGVVNIITKDSSETQGGKVSIGAGSSETGDYLAQYGGKVKGAFTYRAFGQFDSFTSNNLPDGRSGADGWQSGSGGFRMDRGNEKTAKDSFSVEGNLYKSSGNQLISEQLLSNGSNLRQPMTDDGFDVTARWTHNISERAQTSLQIYDNHYSREDTGILEHSNTVDVDFQNHIQLGSRNDVVWGAGYRFTNDGATSVLGAQRSFSALGYFVQIAPAALDYSLPSAFFQDEIKLAENLSLTAGAKLEHNFFTGFQYEPSLRLAWTPSAKSTEWAAASQASRQPSRLETGLDLQYSPLPIAPNVYLNVNDLGNADFQSERMRDYETGYRIIPNQRVSFDVTSFFSLYRDLQSGGLLPISTAMQPDGLHFRVPLEYQNGFRSEDYGIEFASTWNVAPRWKLSGNYSWIRVLTGFTNPFRLPNFGPLATLLPPQFLTPEAIQSFSPSSSIGAAVPPENQAALQSYVDVSKKLSFDNSVYFVGRLGLINVPAYTRVDSRFGYKFNTHFEARLSGQNLLSPGHLEFASVAQVSSVQVPRSIFGNVVWTF